MIRCRNLAEVLAFATSGKCDVGGAEAHYYGHCSVHWFVEWQHYRGHLHQLQRPALRPGTVADQHTYSVLNIHSCVYTVLYKTRKLPTHQLVLYAMFPVIIEIVEPVRAITVHVHGRFINGIRIQLGDVINK